MSSKKIKNLRTEELCRLLTKTHDDRMRNKIRAALAVKEKKSITEVSHIFKVTRQTIYNWIDTPKGYFVNPKPRRSDRRGRPAKWTKQMDRLLIRSLKRHPFELGLSALNWTIPVLTTHFYQETGLLFSHSTFQRKLHENRVKWKRPRYLLLPDPELLKKRGAFVLE